MRLGSFALMSAAGMAATSLAVWHATGAVAQVSPAAPVERPGAEAPAPALDRSHFKAGGTLRMEGRLGHPVLPAQADSENFLFVDVSADASARPPGPTPLDLTIAIDRSGSMSGRKLANALAAARTALGRLRDGDVVSVVLYNTRTEVLVPPTRIDAASRSRIAARLEGIRATGDTCISCAIEAGMRLIDHDDRRVSRILLLSDGEATSGVRDVVGFQQIAERCRRMGTSITTIGVDVDYNERIMATLARDSNGGHFFVRDPSDLSAVFDQETATLASTVATGAELTVDLAPGVAMDQVFDRAFSREGSRVVVQLGSFAGAEEKTLLMRLRVPSGPAGARPVAAVSLGYHDLAGGGAGRAQGELAAVAAADPGAASPLDGVVSARVSASETAAALEEANALAHAGKLADASQVIGRRREALRAASQPAARITPDDRQPLVDRSFARQDELLEQATQGFATDQAVSFSDEEIAGITGGDAPAAGARVGADPPPREPAPTAAPTPAPTAAPTAAPPPVANQPPRPARGAKAPSAEDREAQIRTNQSSAFELEH